MGCVGWPAVAALGARKDDAVVGEAERVIPERPEPRRVEPVSVDQQHRRADALAVELVDQLAHELARAATVGRVRRRRAN